MAIGVVKLIEDNEPEYKNHVIILSGIKELGDRNCLDFAVKGNHQQFVATSCVQSVITKIWDGFIPPSDSLSTQIKVNSALELKSSAPYRPKLPMFCSDHSVICVFWPSRAYSVG